MRCAVIRVFNARLGLATNSSSTHSLIFLPEGKVARDDGVEDMEFGWDRWTAASPEAKKDYLALLLHYNLRDALPANVADMVCREWLGFARRPSDGDLGEDGDGYIDHQSVYALPAAFGTKIVDDKFFAHLRDFVLRPNLAILGGNDNTDESHPLGGGFVLPMQMDGREDSTCRFDEAGKYWVIFNRKTGAKIRFSFERDPAAMTVNPEKAEAPELVDVKITDLCHFGCPFCYMGSTGEGKHADHFAIYQLSEALAQLKVFEVAIGGGEPTMHPDFPEILEMFREDGIVPNFTTKNLGWLRDPALCSRISMSMGAFAFSIDKDGYDKQIKELLVLTDLNKIGRERVSVQAIIGPTDKVFDNTFSVESLVEACAKERLRLTLLGYKDTGRGKEHREKSPRPPRAKLPKGWWVGAVKAGVKKSGGYASVGIDTVLAAEAKEGLMKVGVPGVLLTTKEGKFSCFVDAVKREMAPSSYCAPEERVLLGDISADRVKETFATF
jgi:hypothetical protein